MPSVRVVLVEVAACGFGIHTGLDDGWSLTERHLGVCPVAARGRSRGSMTRPNGQVQGGYAVRCAQVSHAFEVGTGGACSGRQLHKVWFLLR